MGGALPTAPKSRWRGRFSKGESPSGSTSKTPESVHHRPPRKVPPNKRGSSLMLCRKNILMGRKRFLWGQAQFPRDCAPGFTLGKGFAACTIISFVLVLVNHWNPRKSMEIQDPLLPLVKNLKIPGILDFGAENHGNSDRRATCCIIWTLWGRHYTT